MTSTQAHPPTHPDPGPPVPSDGARPQDFDVRLAALETGLATLLSRTADDSARAAARERVIDRQHAEIERLRSAERSGLLRPVVTDLYRLRNDLLRQTATTPAEISGAQVRGLLQSFAEDVADALERCGVTVLPCPLGAPAEAGRHLVATVLPTDQPQLDGTIAHVVQDGYLEPDTGRVVTPARIALYRFGAQAEPEGKS